MTQVVQAASGRLGSGANGVLLDANGLVIANTFNAGWLMRPPVTLAAPVEASLLAGSVWGPGGATPPALADETKHSHRRNKQWYRKNEL